MSKSINYFFVIAIIAFLTACDSESKFHDLAQAIERNKLNISSIVVVPTKSTTIAINGVPCDPCASTYLSTNRTEAFTAYGLTSDNQRIVISDRVTWSTSDSTKAQINQNGTLTTQATLGEVDVIASFASIDGRATVTVSSATINQNTILFKNGDQDISGTTPDVDLCDTFPMSIIGDFGDSQRIITHDIDWDITVASVINAEAKVVLNESTNLAVFSSYMPRVQPPDNPYEVHASYQNDPSDANSVVSRILNVNVIGDNFGSSISITPTPQPISVDEKFQLSATALINTVMKNINSTARWRSDDDSKVSVTDGVITGVASTTTPIPVTATCGGVSGSALVTVEATPDLVAIKIKDVNEDTITVLDLTLSSTTDNEEDVIVMASYTNQEDSNITDELADRHIDITALDGNLPLPISYELLPDQNRIRITARRLGAAVLKVTYLGQEDTLTVNVQ
ncbi:hypothetical protein [Kaarinaea lacus]